MKSHRKYFVVALKVAVLILLLYAIYKQVFHHRNTDELVRLFTDQLDFSSMLLIVICIFLMPVNWMIETFKWRMLIKRIEEISFARSFSAILSGITVSIITPARIGEYGGRILFLTGRNRLLAIPVTILGSIAQILIIIIMGLSGGLLFAFEREILSENFLVLLSSAALFTGAILFYVYFNPDILSRIFSHFSFFKKIERYIDTLNRFTNAELFHFLLLSFMRYLVFTLQYVLLLKAFGTEISILQGFGGISIIFLAQTFLPVPAIAELGLRGNMALFVFTDFAQNELSILAAVLSIWIINLMIPALTGYLFIARKKL